MTSPSAKRALNWGVVAAFGCAIGVVVVAYPYAIDATTRSLGVRGVALLLLALFGATLLWPARSLQPVWRASVSPSLGIPVVLAAAALTDRPVFLQLVPAFVYATLAEVCRVSLRSDASLIERAVRYLVPEAPDFVRSYCRKLTALWAGFFGSAAVIIATLAVFGGAGSWGAFTGWWVYVAMISVSLVEFFVRKTWFRHYYHGGPFDRLWSRWFPAENTPQGRASMESIRRFREQRKDGPIP